MLSRTRPAVISRPNWAKENSTLSVGRPIEVEDVLQAWVTDTKEQ